MDSDQSYDQDKTGSNSSVSEIVVEAAVEAVGDAVVEGLSEVSSERGKQGAPHAAAVVVGDQGESLPTMIPPVVSEKAPPAAHMPADPEAAALSIALMNELAGFSIESPQGSTLFGYDTFYLCRWEIRFITGVKSDDSPIFGHQLVFAIHTSNNKNRPPAILTEPDSDQPFHPRFQRTYAAGKPICKWHDPSPYDRDEELLRHILRMCGSLLFYPVYFEYLNTRAANPTADSWVRRNKHLAGLFPTDVLKVREEDPGNGSDNVASAPVDQPANFHKPDIWKKREVSYKPTPVHWRQYPTEQEHRAYEDHHDHHHATLYFSLTAFRDFKKHVGWGMVEHQEGAIKLGLYTGEVFLDEKGMQRAWVEAIHPYEATVFPSKDPHCLNRAFDQIYRGLKEKENQVPLGWYWGYHHQDNQKPTTEVENFHRRHFDQDWHYLVYCNRRGKCWRVFHSADLKPCQGRVFNSTQVEKPSKRDEGVLVEAWKQGKAQANHAAKWLGLKK